MTATFLDDRPDSVAASFCRFDHVSMKFSAAETVKGKTRIPFRMVARTRDVLNHYYWGRLVHDFKDFTHRSTIPVDYCHFEGQILGLVNQFEVTEEGLVLSGYLVPKPNNPTNIVNEVLDNVAEEVPYQASIDFSRNEGLEIEEVPEGSTVLVNGDHFEGPGIVFRKWTLKGVALCPYGYDYGTSSEVQLSNQPTVSITYQGNVMTKTQTKTAGNSSEGGKTEGQLTGKEGGTKTDVSSVMEKILTRLDGLEKKFSDGQPKEPEEPEDPIKQFSDRLEAIEKQLTAASGSKPGSKGQDGGKGSDQSSEDDKAISQLSEKLDQVLAKFDHQDGSSSEAAAGGEGGSEKKFSDLFKPKK